MTGPVIFLAAALAVWALIILVSLRRERRQFEAQVTMWADLLAQVRETERRD